MELKTLRDAKRLAYSLAAQHIRMEIIDGAVENNPRVQELPTEPIDWRAQVLDALNDLVDTLAERAGD